MEFVSEKYCICIAMNVLVGCKLCSRLAPNPAYIMHKIGVPLVPAVDVCINAICGVCSNRSCWLFSLPSLHHSCYNISHCGCYMCNGKVF